MFKLFLEGFLISSKYVFLSDFMKKGDDRGISVKYVEVASSCELFGWQVAYSNLLLGGSSHES